jgi:hypothetical protein
MMISEGETKAPDPRRGESHVFPLLDNDALIRQSDSSSSEENLDCFKPMYESGSMDECPSAPKCLSISRSDVDRDSEESLRRKSFDCGFDAGRQDACSMVRDEMAPQVKSFADDFSLWDAVMLRVEEKSNLQILKMAVAIAEKIIGAPPQSIPGGLEGLRDDLSSRMRKAYQIEVKLNPADMEALTGFLACGKVPWEEWHYIRATSDIELQRGELSVQTGAQDLSSDDGVLRSLDASLSEVSTK